MRKNNLSLFNNTHLTEIGMIKSFNFRIIKAGLEVEVYDYLDRDVVSGYTRKSTRSNKEQRKYLADQAKRVEEEIKSKIDLFAYQQYNAEQEVKQIEQEKEQTQKAVSSIRRTRTKLRRLINANTGLNKFITLTFAKNITDIKEAHGLFDHFIKRMVRRYENFKYLAVIEFQKRGAVHYHLLCNLPFVEHKKIAQIWRQGMITINRVDRVKNLGAYFCKYLGKDMTDKRMFGKKKFFRSQTLNEPIKLTGYEARQWYAKFVAHLEPNFKAQFKSEYLGKIDYSTFTLSPILNIVAETEMEERGKYLIW